MNKSEIVVFIVYLVFMLGIGVYFFFKERGGGEKTFFLGDRKMGAWVGALSAGASDMSAWVLMGLPTAIYAAGLGEVWISVGLAIGYTLSWIFEAPRLRRFSVVAGDAITIPQYLSNRFLASSKALQVICALVFLVAYTVYTAASIKACGILFHKVIGMDATLAMWIGTAIIVGYTFFGGFSAVCWTDFFQGLLILAAMLLAPLFAVFVLDSSTQVIETAGYWNPFADWRKIVSGLAWGLGYFGMPHIIIRFMSLESQTSLKKSAKIGISWTVLIVTFAALIGIIGRLKLGLNEDIQTNELVFIQMVRMIFPGVISGVLLSAVLAASMSTADRTPRRTRLLRSGERRLQTAGPQRQGGRQRASVGRSRGGYSGRRGRNGDCQQSESGKHHGTRFQRVGRVRRGVRSRDHAFALLAQIQLYGRSCRYCRGRAC